MEDKNIVKGSFKDSAEISDWARDYVNRLGRNYIMNGYGVDLYYDIPGATKVRYYSYEPFTLDRSNFAPTDNFTREQSLIIAKRIYASEPVYSDNTYSWDMGDNVTLYENADTLWAEVNGSVTFCHSTPQNCINSFYNQEYYNCPETSILANGDKTVIIGKEIYNLNTGELVAAFDNVIKNAYPHVVSVLNRMWVMGFPEDDYECVYDYDMNIVTKGANAKGYHTLKTVTDSNGALHYMYYDGDDGMVFTKANGLDAAFKYMVGNYSGIDCENGIDIVKTIEEVERSTYKYRIYSIDGRLLYEGSDKAYRYSPKSYAVEKENGITEIYSEENNELVRTFSGKVEIIFDEYVEVKSEKEYAVYKNDGTLVLDGIKQNYFLEDKNYDKKYTAYITEDKTIISEYGTYKPVTEIQGSNVKLMQLDGQEYFSTRHNEKGRLYTREGELLLESDAKIIVPIETGYIAYTDPGYKNQEDTALIVMYDKDGKEIKRLDKKLEKRYGRFFMTDDCWLYNAGTGEGTELCRQDLRDIRICGDTLWISFGDGHDRAAAIYSSKPELIKLLEFNSGCQDYVIGNYSIVRNYNRKPVDYDIYDIRTGEIVYNTTCSVSAMTVGDKKYITVYNDVENGKTEFYSTDSLELIFELEGKKANRYNTPKKYIMMEFPDKKDGGYLYDENGSFIRKMKNPMDYPEE